MSPATGIFGIHHSRRFNLKGQSSGKSYSMYVGHVYPHDAAVDDRLRVVVAELNRIDIVALSNIRA